MKREEIQAMKRRAEEIADKTIGQGYAGTNERLFADWAHQQACEVIALVAEVEHLGEIAVKLTMIIGPENLEWQIRKALAKDGK